ncbi:oligopeptide transport system substrate-binding protein [Planomicrobium soli]|uniref:Oligopeptide transport system substrate-binding protein n=1 Tax=Planomicrobium soli TaxID=1176648 RepID=A0A2P8G339_9BACL|nr:peptide ABC transporter substrate-binding protein [Planomicrobium soli]PSL28393.1 oligopeptide transport system substrate-binding protein [Planomicrobium soli]
MKNHRLFLLLVLAVSLIIAACSGKDEQSKASQEREANPSGDVPSEPDTVQELNLVDYSEIPTMDSAIAGDVAGFNLLINVNEGLYRLNQENTAEPAIAEGKPEISEDGLVYTFKLRNANWSDGTPVTAQDFVFAWQRAIDPETGSPYGPYMMAGTIKNAEAIAAGEMNKTELGIEAADDRTLIITLERPVPYFMSLMAFPTFFPQQEDFVAGKGEDYASNSENILYNGPFLLKNWNGTGTSWSLEKNSEYWDSKAVTLDKINFDVVKDTNTEVNLYNSGEKDRAVLTGEFARQYSDSPEIIKEKDPAIAYMKFNQERDGKKTPLANEKIRKAIAKAFDKQELTDSLLADGAVPANYIVPSDFIFDEQGNDFRSTNEEMLEFDAEEAKKLWAQGMEEEGLNELTLELLGDDIAVAKIVDEYIKNQLEQNLDGLTLNLKAVPFNVRLELDEAQDYELQSAAWGPDYQDPMTYLDLFVTDSLQNRMSYSNSEFDALIESAKGQLAMDPAARWDAMAQAERILIEEDAAIAPVFQFGSMVLQKPYVKGIVKHPFGGQFGYKWAYISGKE